ncbi:class I SAM-dependent DNA methyltransferase [Streptococcus halichoeri]|uniref:class I SAM-dependent DNA methyltransferase n=1 Tax=Streptococcus halichoeri TaxID=254785 RepID=UPI001359ACC0|nr:class I SAM-dependent methyltransferase [Streptococcus halichoeri]
MSNNDYQQENYNDNFSLFYNKYLTGQANSYGNFIRQYLNKQGVSQGSIIDIMCGTGNLLIQFEEDGWITSGVDISKSMLRIAKTNLLKTKLIQADVTKFHSDVRFQVVVSTADAFNHIEQVTEIEETFKNVFSMLTDSGYFIFDMNTLVGIKKNNYYISSSDEDGISIREGFVDEIHGVGFTRFYGAFRLDRNSSYLRFDSTIYNYYHDIQRLKQKLLEIGFNTVNIMDGYSDHPWNPKRSERVLFICTKS